MKTICPLGWSEAEGDGTEVSAEEEMDVGVIVEKLKTGVTTGCVAWGEVIIEGVEA